MADDAPGFGLLACEGYLPRWRIERRTITEAIGWARGRVKPGQGTRSFANWDEDSLTMAVEAARSALNSVPGFEPPGFTLASTSMPFAERSNAGIAREALVLPAGTSISEASGSRRAATTVLGQAWEAGQSILLGASDCVDTRPGSDGETELGHGAAAVVLGEGEPLAELLAWRSHAQDFVDRYRQSDQKFDYRLEARWVRDAGIRKPLAALLAETLDAAGVSAQDVNWFLSPFSGPVTATVQRDAGLSNARLVSEQEANAGLCGNAQPFLLLAQALRLAEPGETILMVGEGQGFDALLLKVRQTARPAVPGPEPRVEVSYTRYLGIRGLLDIDGGLRSERDNRTSQAAAARRHEELHGLLGGRCSACDKLQFPITQRCVHCHESHTQQAESMAASTGEVNSFTEDWLAWSPRPPLIFGNVHFPGQANIMMEFTDFDAGELVTGQPVRMAFRIKDFDDRRGFRRYFWKPAPMAADLQQEAAGEPAHG